MKIKFSKFSVLQGKYEHNFNIIKKEVEIAKREGYDLIVFQSQVISGVFIAENLVNAKEIVSYNTKIQQLATTIAIMWGNLNQNYQVSMFFAYNDKVVETTKVNRNERFFNESKYFNEGTNEIKSIQYKNKIIHFGFGSTAKNKEYHILFDQREVGNTVHYNIENGVYINHFGCENYNKNVIVFEGEVIEFSNGELISCADGLMYEYLQENIKTSHTLLDTIIFALQSFDYQVFNHSLNWIIGISGGLDSSISVALLCLAFGSKRVIGYNLATQYNTQNTISIADHLASKLNFTYRKGVINELTNATHQVIKEYGYDQTSDLTNQNIQARLRGHLLSTFASIENGVIVNNGNKVETALGYATLYGDLIGAISPLADLTKVQLFDLAREINHRYEDEIIPEILLPQSDGSWHQKPSAELTDNQFDPMKWYYHDYLISNLNVTFTIYEFMENYLNDCFDDEVGALLERYDLLDPLHFIEDLEWVLKSMNRNKYKLVQAPPILSLSTSTFGSDLDIIQGIFDDANYIQLKTKILNKK